MPAAAAVDAAAAAAADEKDEEEEEEEEEEDEGGDDDDEDEEDEDEDEDERRFSAPASLALGALAVAFMVVMSSATCRKVCKSEDLPEPDGPEILWFRSLERSWTEKIPRASRMRRGRRRR